MPTPRNVNLKGIRNQNLGTSAFEGYPDECPRCHMRQIPNLLGGARSMGSKENAEEAFQCTSSDCGGLFIAAYRRDGTTYNLTRVFPVEFVKPIIGELVEKLSPVFVETYGQALHAEALNLTQLTGIGLRKALEFLVKDFATSESSTDEERGAIRAKMLGKCIKEHVVDRSVQEVAKRAAWLGNDETHYVRRWEDKDISDLKVLLRLTINLIENRLLERKYLEEMPDGTAGISTMTAPS